MEGIQARKTAGHLQHLLQRTKVQRDILCHYDRIRPFVFSVTNGGLLESLSSTRSRFGAVQEERSPPPVDFLP